MMANTELANILPKAGELSKTGWSLPATMTESDWKEAGAALAKVEGAMMWWIGDWWAFGEHGYGDRKALVESEEWDGPTFDVCTRAATVSKSFERTRRRLLVSFSHHMTAQGLPPTEADKILDWCESGLSTHGRLPTIKATRERVKHVKAWLAQGWTTDQLERKEGVEAGYAVVASKRDDGTGKQKDAALIAWADQQGLMVEVGRNTQWGNPFEMPGDGDRDAVCDHFADHYLPHKPSLLKKLQGLKGKVLVCWCHPERCHGDHLAEVANNDH